MLKGILKSFLDIVVQLDDSQMHEKAYEDSNVFLGHCDADGGFSMLEKSNGDSNVFLETRKRIVNDFWTLSRS
jgi:hypothetical protein